eukprot:Amastigsp_a521547_9.p4 type:complete len:108 gc:universal Amastigsp_a521547_9:115-438(+)
MSTRSFSRATSSSARPPSSPNWFSESASCESESFDRSASAIAAAPSSPIAFSWSPSRTSVRFAVIIAAMALAPTFEHPLCTRMSPRSMRLRATALTTSATPSSPRRL